MFTILTAVVMKKQKGIHETTEYLELFLRNLLLRRLLISADCLISSATTKFLAEAQLSNLFKCAEINYKAYLKRCVS